MLYFLLYEQLHKYVSPFRVFSYTTSRTAFASLTALFLCIALGPWLAQFTRLAGVPFATFFIGVIAVTFLCGSIAGLLASALSIAVAWQFIIEPR